MYVAIGGLPQWVEFETEFDSNPILLLVHGGPGASTRPASGSWRAWRRDFTLVHWDQRGAGRTFLKNGVERSGPMTFEQFVSDGVEVAEFVRGQFPGRPILLLGHSWGSALGVHLVRRRPDLFAAYVGVGQFVSSKANETSNYERELVMARRSGNQAALEELAAIGPPPYADLAAIKVLRQWADVLTDGTGDAPQPRFTGRPDNLSPEDVPAIMEGFAFSTTALFSDLCAIDLPALGYDFDLPMFCFMGTHNQQTPIGPAEAYFERIVAPSKAFVRFEGCHHFVHMNRPDDFLAALRTHLTPIAARRA